MMPNVLPNIIGIASNVRGGKNPPFDISDFAAMYPQFFKYDDGYVDPEEPGEPDEPDEPDEPGGNPDDDAGTEPLPEEKLPEPLIPLVMLQAYIDMAHACVKISRFKEVWKVCIGLFIAHFVTLYLKSMVDPYGSAADVANAGQAGGLMSSKSVDGVSVSYDYSAITNDMEGWAGWKETAFGTQLATWAKMFSMAGMYVR